MESTRPTSVEHNVASTSETISNSLSPQTRISHAYGHQLPQNVAGSRFSLRPLLSRMGRKKITNQNTVNVACVEREATQVLVTSQREARQTKLLTSGLPGEMKSLIAKCGNSPMVLASALGSKSGDRKQELLILLGRMNPAMDTLDQAALAERKQNDCEAADRLNQLSNGKLLQVLASKWLPSVPTSERYAFASQILVQSTAMLGFGAGKDAFEEAHVLSSLAYQAVDSITQDKGRLYDAIITRAGKLPSDERKWVELSLKLVKDIQHHSAATRDHEKVEEQIKSLSTILEEGVSLPSAMRLELGRSIFGCRDVKYTLNRMDCETPITQYALALKEDVVAHPAVENVRMLTAHGGTLDNYLPFSGKSAFIKHVVSEAQRLDPEEANRMLASLEECRSSASFF